MHRKIWLGALGVASLLLTGCAASASSGPVGPTPEASHSMPDGTEMSGSEHEAHEPEHESVDGPSEAARMTCAGQVVTAVTKILALQGDVVPSSTWEKPAFDCIFDVDGRPLVLSVHDATDVEEGEAHFAALRESLPNAEDIEGLLGLGLPSFSTGDGKVAFLRDGKTLSVDATALPDGLGPDGTRTQDQVAYAVASAVLTCWVNHS
jgi:hypothetical protein